MTKQFWVYDADDKQVGDPVIAASHEEAAQLAALRTCRADVCSEERGRVTVSDWSGMDVRRFTFLIRVMCDVWRTGK